VVPSGSKAQFRGISVLSDKVAWLAGSNGTFGRLADGEHWHCNQIPGAEKLNFRSIVGFDADHAVILAIGPGDQSKIFATSDGGTSWSLRWTNDNSKAFYDSMAFWDSQHGIGSSDPVDGHFLLITTDDGGQSWRSLAPASMPMALKGEGAFSASGTCIVTSGRGDVWIGTGSAGTGRVFHSTDRGNNWSVSPTSIAADKETSGIFGLKFKDTLSGIAVGGDYKNDGIGSVQIALTEDGGKSWTRVQNARTKGLREAVAHLGSHILAVGPKGCDLSSDKGRSWLSVPNSPLGLHTCEARNLCCWAAGDKGLIARFILSPN
jgi:photosystem II stability/assembly factor-like uncharacterized protein